MDKYTFIVNPPYTSDIISGVEKIQIPRRCEVSIIKDGYVVLDVRDTVENPSEFAEELCKKLNV